MIFMEELDFKSRNVISNPNGIFLHKGITMATSLTVQQKKLLALLGHTSKEVQNQGRLLFEGIGLDCLRGADLSGVDLRGADLHDADLRSVDLSHSLLLSINLRGANLQDAKLEGARLEYARMSESNLTNVHFQHADLSCAKLNGCTIKNSNTRPSKHSQPIVLTSWL